MKKFYLIIRRKFLWELLLITILLFAYPSISKGAFTSYGTNAVNNWSAETGDLTGWTLTGAGFSSLASGDNPKPKDGTKVFDYYIASSSSATLTQIISLSSISSDILAGKVKAVLTGSINKLASGTIGYIRLEELNSGGSILNTQTANCLSFGAWEDQVITVSLLNTATSQIRITLYGMVTGGGDYCDFDAINLTLYRWPVVTTTTAATVTTNSAILGGNVTLDGGPSATRGIIYSTTNTNPTIGGANVTQVVDVSSGAGIFTTTVSGLSGAQKYYYNAYATNTLGTVYGTVNNFTTVTPTFLTATTNEATNVTINSATLNGSVNANNHTTDVYFQYGTSASYGTQVAASPATASGNTASTETLSLTGLASSTTYHYRMAAYNATEGWKYGDDKMFTTLTPVPEIGLKQSSTAIADGGSYDFGYHQPSTTTDIIFTIENTGTKALAITTPIAVGGTNSDQFSIQSQPASSVAVSGSTTFTVRFSPTSIGNKTATISITNDDSNENPYDLTITGQGYLAPTVSTSAASNVLATTATLNGSVNANNNSTTVTFQYGLTTSYGSSVTASQSPVTGTSATAVSYALSGLSSNTTYHYRAVSTNSGGTIYGADQTFITPIIDHFTDETTDYAKTFTEGGTTFTMTGYLYTKYEPLGGFTGTLGDNYSISNLYNIAPSAGTFGSILNSTNNFYVNNFWIAPGNASYTFGQYGDVIIRGKRSGTTLFTYTLTSANTNGNYAVNNNYTYIDLSSYNSILIDELEFEVTDNIRYLKIDAFNFNYPAAFAPTVTTQAVNNIEATTATGNGNITNLGNPNPTAYGICYGTTSNPDVTGSKVDKGTATATGAFTASITGLSANTTYHVRAFVTNSSGTNYGDDLTFTTAAASSTFQTAGNWSTASNWSAGLPASTTDVTLAANCNVDGNAPAKSVTVNPGIALTITTGKTLSVSGNFILKSDATNGTATLIDNGTLAVSGTTSVEQYLSSARNWYVSSPLSGANAPSGYTYFQYNEPGDNTSYTSPATAYWKSVSIGDGLAIGRGYIAQLASGTSTITFTGGTLNTGDKTLSLTRTTGKDKEGFNLVGNPYPSYLNINDLASNTDIEPSYWYRSKATNYVFDTYNIPSGITTGNSGLAVTANIPPMQAFWLRVKSGKSTASVVLKNANRGHQDNSNNKFRVPAASNETQKILRLQVSNSTNSDEAIVYFNQNAADEFDAYDSEKMSNNNATIPELYTLAGTEKVVINGLNKVTPNKELALGFTTGVTNTFTIKATEISNFDADTKIILKDKLLNTEQELTAATDYSFSSDTVSTASRFSIVFKSASTVTGIDNTTDNNAVNIFRNKDNQITINCNGGIDGTITVCNTLGQKLISMKNTGAITVIKKSFKSGVYVVTANISGKCTTRKVIIN